MLETFAALFAGHVVGDYLGQTKRMVDNKEKPTMLALHVGIVVVATALALGVNPASPDTWIALGVLTISHAAMDVIKTHLLPPGRLGPYLTDQAVHVLTVVILAAVFPDLMASGLWGQMGPATVDGLTIAYLAGAFAIYAIVAGDYAVQLLLMPLMQQERDGSSLIAPVPAPAGVPLAGKRIGQLERGLVFLLMLTGYPAGIAFLVAAKGILRFDDIQKDRAASEYVIVGTLASVAWAMLCAMALLLLLPDGTLEALRPNP